MHILLFSPKSAASRSGNWTTVSRWKSQLQAAGHQVRICIDPDIRRFGNEELLIGLHARRSAKIVLRFQKSDPARIALIALTGTDVYRDLPSKRNIATMVRALDTCDQIIALQPLMKNKLPTRWKQKTSVVKMDVKQQSLPKRKRNANNLDVCVVGHLRKEKDPFRTEMAVRNLASDYRIRVQHAGGARTTRLQQLAAEKSVSNDNWHWLGSVTRRRVQSLMRKSDLLVNSSAMEGAPNILFEAMSVGMPMLLSRIDGHVGILDTDYRGYFRVGDTDGLRKLLLRFARDIDFRDELARQVMTKSKQFRPGNERRDLLKAIHAATR